MLHEKLPNEPLKRTTLGACSCRQRLSYFGYVGSAKGIVDQEIALGECVCRRGLS